MVTILDSTDLCLLSQREAKRKGGKQGGGTAFGGALGNQEPVESGQKQENGEESWKVGKHKTKSALKICWGIFGTMAGAVLFRYVWLRLGQKDSQRFL